MGEVCPFYALQLNIINLHAHTSVDACFVFIRIFDP